MEFLNDLLKPVMDQLGGFMPDAVGAVIVFLVGYVVARLLASGTRKLVDASGLGARMGSEEDGNKLAHLMSRLVFFLVLLFVLVFVLNSLGYSEVLQPISSMFDTLLGAVPNIIGAGFIGLAGYVLAYIVASLVEMAGGGIEALMSRGGLTGIDVSKVLYVIAFVLVFAPFLLAALEKLDIQVISEPATNMMTALLGALPKLLKAALILTVAIVGGRIISSLVQQLLVGIGADTLPARIGADGVFAGTSFARFASNVLLFFIVLSAAVQAAAALEMAGLSAALNQVLTFAGSILVGLVILAVGNWLANIAYQGLTNAGSSLAPVARFAILGLVLAMGLRAMGLADDIVNLAFGLTLGSLAVAFALAFGLGGRDAAGQQVQRWLGKIGD